MEIKKGDKIIAIIEGRVIEAKVTHLDKNGDDVWTNEIPIGWRPIGSRETETNCFTIENLLEVADNTFLSVKGENTTLLIKEFDWD